MFKLSGSKFKDKKVLTRAVLCGASQPGTSNPEPLNLRLKHLLVHLDQFELLIIGSSKIANLHLVVAFKGIHDVRGRIP